MISASCCAICYINASSERAEYIQKEVTLIQYGPDLMELFLIKLNKNTLQTENNQL